MELTLCTQGILSILLVTIVCVTIGISYQDTLIIIITILVSFYYFNKYIVSRDFMDLTKKDIKLKVEASLLDKKLHPLKWITFNNKTNPKKEIKDLQEVIEIIKNEKKK